MFVVSKMGVQKNKAENVSSSNIADQVQLFFFFLTFYFTLLSLKIQLAHVDQVRTRLKLLYIFSLSIIQSIWTSTIKMA